MYFKLTLFLAALKGVKMFYKTILIYFITIVLMSSNIKGLKVAEIKF